MAQEAYTTLKESDDTMTMEHIDRYFQVNLHIQHPKIDPQEISDALQLNPKRSRPAGPPRKPPFDLASWSYDFDVKGARELGVILEAITEQLECHKGFFRRIVDEGGRVELFCGIHAAGNWDEIFGCGLMGQLSDLAIDLRLDVYTPKPLPPLPE